MGRQKRFSCGRENCFMCPYPDCIEDEELKEYKKKYREEHKDHIKELTKSWYDANRDYVLACQKARRHKALIQKMRICYWCSQDNDKQTEAIKYHKRYFCSIACVGAYMIAEAKRKEELQYIPFGEGEQASGAET